MNIDLAKAFNLNGWVLFSFVLYQSGNKRLVRIAAVLSRSPMKVKHSLNELETAELIRRVRQGAGEPNRIYLKFWQNTPTSTGGEMNANHEYVLRK